MAACEVPRDTCGSFADQAKLLDDCAAEQLGLLKSLEIRSGYEPGNVIGGLNDDVEIPALLPHR
jgi:hypothetical protein